jgi:hypothetical protein
MFERQRNNCTAKRNRGTSLLPAATIISAITTTLRSALEAIS